MLARLHLSIAITLSLSLLFTAAAHGHEFWIEPSSYAPRAKEVLKLGLRVGDDYPGEIVKRDATRIVRFVCRGPTGEADVRGLDGSDLAGVLRVENPGVHLLAYRSNHASVELSGKKFERYLEEEGLEHIRESRAQRGESDKPGREIYSRAAKCLIYAREHAADATVRTNADARTGADATEPAQAASAPAADAALPIDAPLGLTLELIPLRDPRTLKPGDEMKVRLLHQGKPLEGVLIKARSPKLPGERLTARSDAAGEASLKLPQAGVWMIAATHMLPAPLEQRARADWESIWASLTFEIPGPTRE